MFDIVVTFLRGLEIYFINAKGFSDRCAVGEYLSLGEKSLRNGKVTSHTVSSGQCSRHLSTFSALSRKCAATLFSTLDTADILVYPLRNCSQLLNTLLYALLDSVL